MTQGYTEEWFMKMSNAIKTRDHAKEMMARWEKKVADAEAEIAALSSGTTQQPETVSEQE